MFQRLVLSAGLMISIGLMSAMTISKSEKSEFRKPRIILTKITELREQELVAPGDDEFSMDSPGLELKYNLDMPEGLQLLEITQLEQRQVKAVDSSGRDLSQIEPNFMDKLEYVEMTHFYGEPIKGFTFKLANPSRGAAHFDLNVTLEATTYTGIEEITMPVSAEWSDLDATLFGKAKVQVKLVKHGKSVQLAIQPGTVKNAIEEVTLFNGETELESSFSMWNDSMINYSFNGAMASTMTVKLKVRTGLSKQSITIALNDQPLP